ncbi:hypothetical protein [Gynurincola endophyticus]|jgi:hypothetical protein|uniref:hypothetical protein n=1 Tax=Gynurincola endophyticus TaxID=2479004 RepID=UPI000F8C7AFE|nr:hypothetical protein [Gynurincola endophyticus]
MSFLLKIRSIRLDNNKILVSSFPEFFLVLSVFSKELFSSRFMGADIDWFAYLFASVYFVLNLGRVFLVKNAFTNLFLYILATSLLSIFIFDYSFGGFLKQFIAVFIIYSVNIIVLTRSSYQHVFELYIRFAFYSAIFGIIQYVLFHTVNINILMGPHGRLDSIAYEPSHYAAILIPALIYTFFNFKRFKREFMIMIIALILTFNLTSYLTFLIIIAFSYLNPLYIIFTVPVLYYVIFGYLADFNENFSMRISDTVSVFKGDINILNSTIEANGTTVSMYSNLNVALENVRKLNFIGSGMGGNEEAYYNLYANTMFRYNYFYGLNANAGHSLTIRIFSEFGVIGLLIYLYTIIRRVVFMNGQHKIIALACSSHFLVKTFKLGAYIDYGTPFFIAMLFVNYLDFRKK